MKHDIDLVITWVDGNDPAWQAAKAAAIGTADDGGTVRYRDWDLLPYLFRGIDTFLPFIRTVHLVTWGHLPSWLNTNAPRLHIVRHEDYLPEAYRPTFNSNAIELNVHRIEGLAEHFIYANDDMFFLRPLSPDFFFQNGLPVDACVEEAHQFFSGAIDHIIGNNLSVINTHFSKTSVLKQQWRQWYSPRQGKGLFKNLYMSPFACFAGFYNPHVPFAYRKSTFEAVWAAEEQRLDHTCRHTLRSIEDVNHWLCRYWQFVTGSFAPADPRRGRFFSIGRDDALIADAIRHAQYPMICLNDDDPALDFETEKQTLQQLFEQLLPEPSAFER